MERRFFAIPEDYPPSHYPAPPPAAGPVSGSFYRQAMTTSPNSPTGSAHWVLQATITTGHGDGSRWHAQLDTLRPIATYNPDTQMWRALIGALDREGLGVLQTLFDAAHTYGTEVRLSPVAVPSFWRGPVFTSDPDLASSLEAQAGAADTGRPLGQLPLR